MNGRPDSGETLYGKVARLVARGVPVKPFVVRRPGALISFTFDDCFDSATRLGADMLADAGMHGTFYAAGGLCDGDLRGSTYFDAPRLGRLAAEGHEIGCHSSSHDAFVSRTSRSMRTDWEANAEFLKHSIGIDEVHTFSYPYGYWDARACFNASKRFAACRGTRPGINGRLLDLAKLRANPIGPTEELSSRARALVGQVERAGGWLIFYTHDVAERPTPWGCTPAAFSSLIATVAAAGVPVLTMKNAIGAISASN